jgi:uncharacterized lipoprotein YehR (DUF1307 family)
VRECTVLLRDLPGGQLSNSLHHYMYLCGLETEMDYQDANRREVLKQPPGRNYTDAPFKSRQNALGLARDECAFLQLKATRFF